MIWRRLGLILIYLILPSIWQRWNTSLPPAKESCGFVQNTYGHRLSWQESSPINLYVHSSFPTELRPAIRSAAKQWELAMGRPMFNIIDQIPISGPNVSSEDGKNIIYYMDKWETNKPNEQARTIIYWVGDLIRETDIRINAKNFKYYWRPPAPSPAINIEAILIHEMGHVLGLKHKDGVGSVMATYLASNLDRITVAQTDIESLKCEY